jgi:aspartate/methionine/tyrosine aminotransferase
MIIINSPHNPTGKIFSNSDYDAIGEMLRKYPKVLVAEDNVYETFVFDGFDYNSIRKLSQREEFEDRCLSIYSAGKLLKATGSRMGWVLGSPRLTELVAAANLYMYSSSCPFIEKTVELSLYDLCKATNTFIAE